MAVIIKNGITPDSGINSKVSSGIASTVPYSDTPGTELGTYHLAANINNFEIQRSNNFMFLIDFGTEADDPLIRAGQINGTIDAEIAKSFAQEVIMLSVSQASVPHFSQGVIRVRRGNSELKYAGVPEFKSGSIEVIDYIGVNTKDILMAWQNLSYNVLTEKVGLASQYKRTCTLVEYAPDGQKVRSWKMHGCWISEMSEPNYNSDGNDKRTISATIEYDRAEPELGD